MSDAKSTISVVNSAGSTRPAAKLDQLAREAAKIREHWKTRSLAVESTADLDSTCFNRHKSLVLKLARDSYVRDVHVNSSGIALDDYCQRYDWLGEPLQKSIFNMLEVQEYAIEHPEIFEATNSFEWPKVGEVFLKFQILEELGRGATGRVYLCESKNLGNKQLVLKVEPGKNETEAALLGKIKHAHITPISWADYDAALDATFLCMPFYGRSTLADLVKTFPAEELPKSGQIIDTASRLWVRQSDVYAIQAQKKTHASTFGSSYVTRVLRLARDLADGLEFVHCQGIAHGDIKPSNVLLSPTGHVYLLDFNLGRARQSTCYRYGGTPPYMSPERVKQVRDNQLDLPSTDDCIAGDIFSFGVLFYELLTGKPPFELSSRHDTAELACERMAQLHERGYQSAVSRNPNVGKRLSGIVDRCLEADPSKRPANMEEISKELQSLVTPSRRFSRAIRRNPRSSASAVLLIASAGIFLGYWLSTRPPLQERLYHHAVAAREQGNFKASLQFLDESMLIKPDHYSTRLLRAKIFNDLGEYSKSAVELLYLERLFPSPRITAYEAYNDQFLGKHAGAALGYEHAIRKGFSNSAILNNLILAYHLRVGRSSSKDLAKLTTPLIKEALILNPNSSQIRMTAFNCIRSYPRCFEQDLVDAAKVHIDWLTKNHPNRICVLKAIHDYYSVLARHGLASEAQLKESQQRLDSATDSTLFKRFMDPLDVEY